MTSPLLPRVLLVEDDPTSRAFLMAAVAGVPAEVDGADCVATALALADAQDYALWLFDAQLPDGSGRELLERLRARHPHTPALAHTAAQEAATRDGLLDAGFSGVLIKPLPAVAVRSAVRRLLRLPDDENAATPAMAVGMAPVWDDAAAALALNGNHGHVQILRGLFLKELAQAGSRIIDALRRGDAAGAQHGLHKLRASCGFVGASRLAAAVHALQDYVVQEHALHDHAVQNQQQRDELHERFEQALRDTLDHPDH